MGPAPPAETSLSFGVSPALVVLLRHLAVSCLMSDTEEPESSITSTIIPPTSPFTRRRHGDGRDEHCLKWAYWRAVCLLPSAGTRLDFPCDTLRWIFPESVSAINPNDLSLFSTDAQQLTGYVTRQPDTQPDDRLCNR